MTETPRTVIIPYSSIVEENGKTIRENNLEIKHRIPVGALVEIHGSDGFSWNGVRLYVREHTRDCDGTPLYSLGHREAVREHPLFHDLHGGFSEDSLTVISLPQ
jgi:hypothetical protein